MNKADRPSIQRTNKRMNQPTKRPGQFQSEPESENYKTQTKQTNKKKINDPIKLE